MVATPDLSLPAEALLVLEAIASDPELRERLVLKGAYATEAVTQIRRSTRDIDLTSRSQWLSPDETGKATLRRLLLDAIHRHCQHRADGWTVYAVSVDKSPRGMRQRYGWDGFSAKITLQYRAGRQHVVELDISSGDYAGSATRLHVDRSTNRIGVAEDQSTPGLYAYSPEQNVAEKLRAFLQKLPAHRAKLKLAPALPRVRDIHDVAAIVRARGAGLSLAAISESFVAKCKAKAVDCESAADFEPSPDARESFRGLYDEEFEFVQDAIPFDDAWAEMMELAHVLTTRFPAPGRFPLPTPVEDDSVLAP